MGYEQKNKPNLIKHNLKLTKINNCYFQIHHEISTNETYDKTHSETNQFVRTSESRHQTIPLRNLFETINRPPRIPRALPIAHDSQIEHNANVQMHIMRRAFHDLRQIQTTRIHAFATLQTVSLQTMCEDIHRR